MTPTAATEPEALPDEICQISTASLMSFLFLDALDPWNREPGLTQQDVDAAMPVAEQYEWPQVRSRAWHAGRVKHLMATSAALNDPIEIDVMPGGETSILDGHHRLYAAYFLGMPTINAIVSGYIDDIAEDLMINPN